MSAVCIDVPEIIVVRKCQTGGTDTTDLGGEAWVLNTCSVGDKHISYAGGQATKDNCAQNSAAETFAVGQACSGVGTAAGQVISYFADPTSAPTTLAPATDAPSTGEAVQVSFGVALVGGLVALAA
jgi:hypothetical protein